MFYYSEKVLSKHLSMGRRLQELAEGVLLARKNDVGKTLDDQIGADDGMEDTSIHTLWSRGLTASTYGVPKVPNKNAQHSTAQEGIIGENVLGYLGDVLGSKF